MLIIVDVFVSVVRLFWKRNNFFSIVILGRLLNVRSRPFFLILKKCISGASNGLKMENQQVQFCWLIPVKERDIPLPVYETEGSAGMDIRAAVNEDIIIEPGAIELISTGFAVAIPKGYEIQVRPRSGLAVKNGITLINSPGTIDSDYRGEVKVPLINHGTRSYVVHRGARIAQMVLASVVRVDILEVVELESTMRGAGGFGHTGV